jgi:hypothetical protein
VLVKVVGSEAARVEVETKGFDFVLEEEANDEDDNTEPMKVSRDAWSGLADGCPKTSSASSRGAKIKSASSCCIQERNKETINLDINNDQMLVCIVCLFDCYLQCVCIIF